MNSTWMHLADLNSIPRKWFKYIKALVYDWLHDWLYNSRPNLGNFRRFLRSDFHHLSIEVSTMHFLCLSFMSKDFNFFQDGVCGCVMVCDGVCFHFCKRSFVLVVFCPIVDSNFDESCTGWSEVFHSTGVYLGNQWKSMEINGNHWSQCPKSPNLGDRIPR